MKFRSLPCAQPFMKTILLLFISLICSVARAENAPSPPPERQTVSIEIENGVELELTARVVAAEKRELHPELCLFEDQLWVGAVSSPPELVMQSAILTLHGEKIELDVSGLANPWIKPSEMTRRDVRLRQLYADENAVPVYSLDICFFKGGALDYIATYIIYHGKSLREKIEFMGDTYPEWRE